MRHAPCPVEQTNIMSNSALVPSSSKPCVAAASVSAFGYCANDALLIDAVAADDARRRSSSSSSSSRNGGISSVNRCSSSNAAMHRWWRQFQQRIQRATMECCSCSQGGSSYTGVMTGRGSAESEDRWNARMANRCVAKAHACLSNSDSKPHRPAACDAEPYDVEEDALCKHRWRQKEPRRLPKIL
jgi:hypothetical protein